MRRGAAVQGVGAVVLLVVLSCLVPVAAAKEKSSTAAIEKVVLTSVSESGYSDPAIIGRGAIYVVTAAKAGGDTAGAQQMLLAVTPDGATLRELGALPPVASATATVAPFLWRKDLWDVTVTTGELSGSVRSLHILVRAATLDPACQFFGSADSHDQLKGQRITHTVKVQRVRVKPLVFAVVDLMVDARTGEKPVKQTATVRYDLPETGTCTERR